MSYMTLVPYLRGKGMDPGTYCDAFDGLGHMPVANVTQTVKAIPAIRPTFQIELDIKVAITILVVDAPALPGNLFDCLFTLQGGLVIGFSRSLAVCSALWSIARFPFSIDVFRQDIPNKTRVFGGKCLPKFINALLK